MTGSYSVFQICFMSLRNGGYGMPRVLTLLSPFSGSTSTALKFAGLLSAGSRLFSQALIGEPQRLAATILHCCVSLIRNLMKFQPSSGCGDLSGSVHAEQAAPWNWPFLPLGFIVTS